jgi:hypothetical protein
VQAGIGLAARPMRSSATTRLFSGVNSYPASYDVLDRDYFASLNVAF